MKFIVHATALLLAGAVANAQDIALSSATIEISPGDAQSAGLRGMPGDASVTLIAKDAESKLVGVSFLPLDPTALYRALQPSVPCPTPDGSAFRLWPYVVAPSSMNSDLACIYKGKVTRCTGSSGQSPDFEARIVHVDIDVDSDNASNPIPEQKWPKQQPYPPIAGAAPEADAQDAIENPQASDALGLLLVVNHGFDSTPYVPTAPREDFQRPNIETVAATDPDLSRGRIAMVAKKNGYLNLTYELSKLRIYRNDGSAPVLMRPGVDIPLAPMELPILLEGVDPGGSDGGTRFSATFRDIDHQSPNKPAEDIVKLTVVDLQIQVDRDRDGRVTGTDLDLTDADHPMVFWLNNDKDDAGDDDEPRRTDYTDSSIVNLRDLEDFQRFIVRVRGVDQHMRTTRLALGLRWMEGSQGNPQVKLFRHKDIDAGRDYTFNESAANALRQQATYIGAFVGSVTKSLDKQWFRAKGDALQAPTVWEANAANGARTPAGTRPPDPATGRFALVIGKPQSGTIQPYALNRHLHLRLGDCRWFYEHKSAGDTVTTSSSFPEPALTTLGDGMADLTQRMPRDLNDPDLTTLIAKDKTMLFVHGYRMLPWERRAFAETTLKRLYWQGYGGRLVLFSWPTDYVATRVGQVTAPQNYDRSEFQARRSGALVLPSVINDVRSRLCNRQPANLCVAGHSMGNIVLSEALRKFTDLTADLYLSFQSAELAGCYKYDVPPLVARGLASIFNSGVYTPDLYRFDAPRQPRSLVTWPQWERVRQRFGEQDRNRTEQLEPVADGRVRHQAIAVSARRRVTYYNGSDVATGFALVATQVAKPDIGFSYLAELLSPRTAPNPIYQDVFRVTRGRYLAVAPWNALPRSSSGAILSWTPTATNFGAIGPQQTMQNAAILAFCARGSTTAVGATNGSQMMGTSAVDPNGRPLPAGTTEAPFTVEHDSRALDNFRDGSLDHSGQFNYHIQRNPGPQSFWQNVLIHIRSN